MKAYPRFAYLVELDPSLASKHNKEAQASTVDPSQRDLGRSLTDKQKKELEEKRKGRRTRCSKSLKAGGLFRPAKFRHDPRFSIDNQIEEVDCPGNGSDEDLNSLVSVERKKSRFRPFDLSKRNSLSITPSLFCLDRLESFSLVTSIIRSLFGKLS